MLAKYDIALEGIEDHGVIVPAPDGKVERIGRIVEREVGVVDREGEGAGWVDREDAALGDLVPGVVPVCDFERQVVVRQAVYCERQLLYDRACGLDVIGVIPCVRQEQGVRGRILGGVGHLILRARTQDNEADECDKDSHSCMN